MFKHQDDSCNGELRSKGRDQAGVNIRGSDVLKTPGDGTQNLDGVFAFDTAMAAVKPGGKSEDDNDESIPQN